jgi:hypothetical protein
MTSKLRRGLGLLLAIALGLRIADWLLRPVLPLLVTGFVLLSIYWLLFRHNYR